MRLPRMMLALLLAFSGVGSFSQAPQPAQESTQGPLDKTLTTHFPLDPNNLEWYFYAETKTMNCWMYSKDINLHNRIITVWTRTYDYKTKLLFVNREKLNRDTKESITLNFTVYDLNSGDVKFSSSAADMEKKGWEAAIPGSVQYALFDRIDVYETYQSEQEKDAAKKKAEEDKRKKFESQFTPYKPSKK